MASTNKLRRRARMHEQRGEWELAIQQYLQLANADEAETGGLDLGIYNRIGDLYLRVGKQAEAVNYYERAAQRYADAGLYNNAIALCNKALRHDPMRIELYRALSRYSADQGFVTDARRWIVEYAERKVRKGSLDEAFAALEEFVAGTGDPEVHELLGRYLADHERGDQAIPHLRLAYAAHRQAGNEVVADDLGRQLLALDPTTDLEAIAAEAPRMAGDASGAATGGALDALPQLEITHRTEPSDMVEPLPGLEAGPADTISPAPDEDAGLSEAGADVAGPAEAGADDVAPPEELLAEVALEADAEEERESTPSAEPDRSGDPDDVLALLKDLPDDDPDTEAVELPLISDPEPADGWSARESPEPAAHEDGEAVELLESVPADTPPPDPGAGDDAELDATAADALGAVESVAPALGRAREMAAAGERAAALEMLESLHRKLAAEGRPKEAIAVVMEQAELQPDTLAPYKRRLEYAVQVGERPALIAAYLELAGCLRRRGSPDKARAVYEHVISLDPVNELARAALSGDEETDGGEEEFVDLGALVDESRAVPATTRWVATAEAPSGDEEADFARMLAEFKARVAEHVGAEDQASHYDLGVAYREMGLLDEAIEAFQTALKGGAPRLKVFEELGQCFMDKAQYPIAMKILERALRLPGNVDEELIGVNYHLGRCYEELGRHDDARDAFERVVGLDMRFRDAAERLARL